MSGSGLVESFLARRRALFAFIFSLTRDFDAAEDVFQELGLAVVDEAARGRSVGDFMAWARELARHRVADYYRRERRRPPPEELAGQIERAFAEHAGSEESDRLRQKALLECLETLPPRSRELVERRYRLGLSPGQIAAAVGWTLGAVKVGLSKARCALAECIRSKLRPA